MYLLTYNRDRDNKIIALSPDGTKTHEIPFDPYASTVVLYSDRYFYCMDGLAPYDTASGFRLDLQTGETTPWDLPAETAAAPDAAGNFAVTARLISDHPVPFTSDPKFRRPFAELYARVRPDGCHHRKPATKMQSFRIKVQTTAATMSITPTLGNPETISTSPASTPGRLRRALKCLCSVWAAMARRKI